MRKVWSGTAAAALLIVLIVPARAQQQDLSGEYVMSGKGVGENDVAYVGTCTLKAVDTLYEVSCFNSDTRHTYVGKGVRLGDQFSTVIGDLLKGDHAADVYAGEYLVVYRLSPDRSMKGRWVHMTSGAHGEETLTPKR
ncbi:MAG: hypothetical protein DI543_20620 [Bradyrhizobium icense]|jgi:hypothetical protein|nr:MAG: hypothetical protein DI543_20620 [Bradyrhizobium icense]